MTGVKRLRVSIFPGAHETEVGELVLASNKVYFRYSSEFVDRGIEISPFKLKLSSEVVSSDDRPFDGLFGVFNDSLPDGWGRLLFDRYMRSKGIPIHDITSMDRLAHVGNSGMGALVYRPAVPPDFEREKVIELDELASGITILLEGGSPEVLDELNRLGGSSGGARPKILVGYDEASDHLIHGTEELPENFAHWIIKFPSSIDPSDIARVEYAYHKMALAAGIGMSECRLFEGASGGTYFGTKRFDREAGERIHMHSASGLLHDDYRMSSMDYGHLMDCAFRLEQNVEAHAKVLRLAAFNVFAHNRDDHSKNFAFLMDRQGSWKMAPAYDLTFSNSAHGHHSTMVAGESRQPGEEQLLELARVFDVKNAKDIIAEVRDSISSWDDIARDCGVGTELRKRIAAELSSIR